MASKINIVITEGPLKDTKYGFDVKMTCEIGRAKSCDLSVPREFANGISKKHCLLNVNPPVITIQDLGSRNGTFVNGFNICDENEKRELGNRVIPNSDEVRLFDEDVFIVGELFFEVTINEDVDGQPPPSEQQHPGLSQKIVPSAANPALDVPLPTDMAATSTFVPPKNVANVAETVQETGTVPEDFHGTNTLRKIAKVEELQESQLFIENFKVQRMIGKGATGLVYLVENLKNGRFEALKLLMPDMALSEDDKKLFLREIEFLRELKHPNIIKVYDSGIAQGSFYFTLEYCDKGNLENMLDENAGPLSVDESLKIMLQSLNALDYAHGKNLVHRDIKPENIFLRSKGKNSYQVKIGDFGVAKLVQSSGFFTETDKFIFGTPDFISRQQILDYNNIGPAMDIWSLTATFYYMLTMKPPRDLDPDQPIDSLLDTNPVPIRERNPEIPEKLAYFIDMVLSDEKELIAKEVKKFRSSLLELI